MNRRNRILGIALAAGLAAAPAFAGQGGHGAGHGGRGMGGLIRHAVAQLDLTPDQQQKVEAMVAAEKPALQSLREEMRADAQELGTLADAQPANPAAVGAAFLKVRGDRQAMRAEMTKLKQQIGTVLTADQRAKLDGFFAAMKGRHGMGRRMAADPNE